MRNYVSVCFGPPVVNNYFRYQSTKYSSRNKLDSHSPSCNLLSA